MALLARSSDLIYAQAKTFFDLPLEKKLDWRLKDAEVNQGYTADGDEANGGIDHKECYEHRRFNNPLCPTEKDLPSFKPTLDEFYQQCLTLGLNVLTCLAMAMELGDNFFDKITAPTLWIMATEDVVCGPLEFTKHWYEKLACPKSLCVLEGEHLAQYFDPGFPKGLTAMLDFVRKHAT